MASGLESKAKKIQSMTLLHVVGSDALEIYNTFRWAEGDCPGECEENLHTTECILKKFENYCTPRKNVTIERHVFFSRNQAAGETFDQYVTDLKLKAKTCEFQTVTDSLIKDRIVGGIRDDKVRARLLREPDLSLNKAEDLSRAAEIADLQMKMMKEEDENETVRTVQAKGLIKDCQYCGNTHQRRKCPAYGKICKKM